MEDWRLTVRDLKNYPHFDPPIPLRRAEAYAKDRAQVERHTFYPFIRYVIRRRRFAGKGEPRESKPRPIRYAARRDAYIFSWYRHILSEAYDAELKRVGLDASVLAYRKHPLPGGEGGKCNIHFASDAFLRIRDLGDCCAIALDISKYFESLDHARLKELWCRMLGVTKLPADHFRVFRAITRYAVVDKERVYERLGHFGEKTSRDKRRVVKGYLTPFNKMPKQLCTGTEFRQKICGENGQGSIIEVNENEYGIPQGAPISDLLANLYLLDFDRIVAGWVGEVDGGYYRYSDDILIIVPGGEAVGIELLNRTQELVRKFGSEIKIKQEKSSLVVFQRDAVGQTFRRLHGTQGKNGLEYLGFRYNGRHVYLRDATLSNLYRKVTRAANREAEICARRYPDKDAPRLKELFNYERLTMKFGRVDDFDERRREYRKWTFWTYAVRASKVFGELGGPIVRQLRNHRRTVRARAHNALERAVVRRERRGKLARRQHSQIS